MFENTWKINKDALIFNGTIACQGITGVNMSGGATGAQGLTGLQGLPGSTGLQGPTGVDGYVGADGETGPQGIQGETGVQGTNGSQGETGVQGTNGSQGETGVQGTNGSQGETGVQGTNGSQGATGVQGTNGSQGETGVQGTNGSQGETGVQGPAGSNGSQGATGVNGSNGSQGNTGLQGQTGLQGPTGIQGITGLQGTTGALGATGPGSLQAAYLGGQTITQSTVIGITQSTAANMINLNKSQTGAGILVAATNSGTGIAIDIQQVSTSTAVGAAVNIARTATTTASTTNVVNITNSGGGNALNITLAQTNTSITPCAINITHTSSTTRAFNLYMEESGSGGGGVYIWQRNTASQWMPISMWNGGQATCVTVDNGQDSNGMLLAITNNSTKTNNGSNSLYITNFAPSNGNTIRMLSYSPSNTGKVLQIEASNLGSVINIDHYGTGSDPIVDINVNGNMGGYPLIIYPSCDMIDITHGGTGRGIDLHIAAGGGSTTYGAYQTFFTGNGGASYSGTFSPIGIGIVPGSVQFMLSDFSMFDGTDNGAGVLTGTGVVSGAVNYSNGNWSITWDHNIDPGNGGSGGFSQLYQYTAPPNTTCIGLNIDQSSDSQGVKINMSSTSTTTTQNALEIASSAGNAFGISVSSKYLMYGNITANSGYGINLAAGASIEPLSTRGMLYLNKQATGSGPVIIVNNDGTGKTFAAANSSTGTIFSATCNGNAVGLEVVKSNTGNARGISVESSGSGDSIFVKNSGAGHCVNIDKVDTGTGSPIYITQNSGTGPDIAAPHWNIRHNGYVQLGITTSASRPVAPAAGMMGWDSDVGGPIMYNGAAWVKLDVSAT